MLIRPASVYRYFIIIAASFFAIYAIYGIIGYDDGSHVPIHRPQRHLYLTVSKDRISNRFNTLAPKRILYWTKVFGTDPINEMESCPGLSDRCVLDLNKDQLESADAVVFHAADLSKHSLPLLRKPNQFFVFHTMETPDNSGRFRVPNNYFNWTMTFLKSSDTIHKYGSFLIKTSDAESRGFKVQSYYVNPKKLAKSKSGIFGLISNCNTASKRELALKKLSKHINVTIGGKCAENDELKSICPMGSNCDEIFEQYPFYIAIENTICNDYITEKFYSRFTIASVPIVMRRKVYEPHLPPHSFIAMDDFQTPLAMATYLKHLEANATAYKQYFDWRQMGTWTTAPWNAPGYRNGLCGLCEKLWKVNGTTESNEYNDVWKWFDDEAKCEKDEFVQKWI